MLIFIVERPTLFQLKLALQFHASLFIYLNKASLEELEDCT